MPILMILAGVGMFIQVMTLTGARGWIVLVFLSLPAGLLYAAIALGMPVFGGISAFGASRSSACRSSWPHLRNTVLTSTALSAIVGLGDLIRSLAGGSRASRGRAISADLRYCLVPRSWSLRGLGPSLRAFPGQILVIKSFTGSSSSISH
jgi:hypothetical protein